MDEVELELGLSVDTAGHAAGHLQGFGETPGPVASPTSSTDSAGAILTPPPPPGAGRRRRLSLWGAMHRTPTGTPSGSRENSIDGGPRTPTSPSRRLSFLFHRTSRPTMGHFLRRDTAGEKEHGVWRDEDELMHTEKLNTFEGVIVPNLLASIGTIFFLRLTWIVGQAGVGGALGIVLLSYVVALLTWMSLSAMATNGVVQSGGSYYLISRAVGPEFGGAVGILYYLGTCLGGALHSLGAAEALHHIATEIDMSSYNFGVIFGGTILFIMAVVVLVGLRWVALAELGVFFVLVIGILFTYAGILSVDDKVDGELPGLSDSPFADNWGPHFESDVNWLFAFGLFFPSVTGMIAGANRSGDLEDPSVSIPRGTLISLLCTACIYISTVFFVGAVATYAICIEDKFILASIAWPNKLFLQLVELIVTSGEALHALFIAPRILQAIAKDNVIPVLSYFTTTTRGEPRRALYLTFFVTMIAVILGDLEIVAIFVTQFLLLTYSFINVSCFVLTILKSPGFRPRWKYFHWSTAFFGGALCMVLMIMISGWFSLPVFAVGAFLYKYIEFKGDENDWGDGMRGLRLQRALESLLALERSSSARVHTKNWRPQVLCLVKLLPDGTPTHPEILAFVSQLKKGHGLSIVAGILEGEFLDKAEEAVRERDVLAQRMEEEGLEGFAQVVVAPTFEEGKGYLLQLSGLGGLTPNTIIIGWPYPWREKPQWADEILTILTFCRVTEKALMVVKGLKTFPHNDEEVEGTIDLWWIVHDGGIELLLAFLLKKHRVWRRCTLRVFTVAEKGDDVVQMKRELVQFMYNLRISAEVEVVELEEEVLAQYTFDRTELAEERHHLLEELHLSPKDLHHEVEEIMSHSHRKHSHAQITPDLRKAHATAEKINRLIHKYSGGATLLVVNLPNPFKGQTPQDWLDYVETLCSNLERVIMIHGSGTEVVTMYS